MKYLFSVFRVNDRIISVNGISLQNVDYATAVQVLRDSGDTVTLVIKRRTTTHNHSHSASFSGQPLPTLGNNSITTKVTLTKNSKKEGKLYNKIVNIYSVIKDLLLQRNFPLLS